METLIADSCYGLTQFLYEGIVDKNIKFNDLYMQRFLISPIAKYIQNDTNIFAQYQRYINKTDYIWRLRHFTQKNNQNVGMFTGIESLREPKVLPYSIDGPFTIDNVHLKTFTHFWKAGLMKSSILKTPYYCLAGIDYLTRLLDSLIEKDFIRVFAAHIFHDNYYQIEITLPPNYPGPARIRKLIWLVWLDNDIDLQSELIVRGKTNQHFLRRLYMAVNDASFLGEMLMGVYPNSHPFLRPIGKLFDMMRQTPTYTSETFDFIRCLNGPPKNYRLVLCENVPTISTLGAGVTPLEITDLNQLVLKRPVLCIQETITINNLPTSETLKNKFQNCLNLIAARIWDTRWLVRAITPSNISVGPQMGLRLPIMYMIKFHVNRTGLARIDLIPPNYEDTAMVFQNDSNMVFVSLRKLGSVCASTPIFPALVVKPNFLDTDIVRLSQTILYSKNLHTVLFLDAFTTTHTRPTYATDVTLYRKIIPCQDSILEQKFIRAIFPVGPISNTLIGTFDQLNLQQFQIKYNTDNTADTLTMYAFVLPTNRSLLEVDLVDLVDRVLKEVAAAAAEEACNIKVPQSLWSSFMQYVSLPK